MTAPLRAREAAHAALWTGIGFGLLEGILQIVSRWYPALQAAHKVSAEALWIAPLVDLPVALAGAVLLLGLSAWRAARGGLSLLTGYTAFAFGGFLTLLAVPGVLHPVSAVMLALGFAVLVRRRLGGREEWLAATLARRIWLPPVLLLAASVGVTGFGLVRERWLASRTPAAAAGRPNVLILVLDTVRRDRLYGVERLTPALDTLARRGATFSNAWAASSWSLPSQATILTGRSPQAHGADWPRLELYDSVPTLPELLRQRGYVTGAFSSNISWATPEYLGRGFLRFQVYRLDHIWRRTVHGQWIAARLRDLGGRLAGAATPAEQTSANLERFLDDYPGRPFFAYVCYMDVNRAFYDHQLTHPRWAKAPPIRDGIAAYDAGLQTLDRRVGELLGRLAGRGVLENTIVIITSDHGESFGSRDYQDHDPKGHGTSLYPEQLRVPLVLIGPGVPAGARGDRTVSLTSIAATVDALTGGDGAHFPGATLLESLPGTASPPDTGATALATLDYDRHSARAAILDTWQYIYNRRRPEAPEELFDLATDSLARINLAPAHPLLPRMRNLAGPVSPEPGSP